MQAHDRLTRKQLALLHIAKKELGLDDDSYRAVLSAAAGVDSAKHIPQAKFGAVLDAFARFGWRPSGSRHHSARSSGMHTRWSRDKWRLYSKIEAQLADLGLPWSYADGMARNMFGISKVRWCTADQLRRIIAALTYHQKRVNRRS